MKPKHNRRFCIGCHYQKMWFETKSKADNFLKFNKESIAAVSSKVPTRSYYCSFCCGWHITSIGDEQMAKERDARDEQLWETIKRKNTKLKKKSEIAEAPKIQIPLKKTLPNTTEGWQIHCLLKDVDDICAKVSSALYSSNFPFSDKLLDAARMTYEETLAKSEEFGIYCKKINMRGDKIEDLANKLTILKSLVGSPEDRKSFLVSLSGTAKDKAFALMVRNLDNIEIVESLFSEASAALANHDSDKVKSICKGIDDIVKNELHSVSQHTHKFFAGRLAKILCLNKAQTEEIPLTESEKKTIIKVIDLLQEAYSALENEDIETADAKTRQAVCLIPEKENESIDILIQEAERINEQIQKASKPKENKIKENKIKIKILFLHGFTSSGSCAIAEALKKRTRSIATVTAPDLPLHPYEAMDMLKELCLSEEFDIIIGSSCGAFYGQQLVRLTGIPAILINPFFRMTEFLDSRIGTHSYKSIRKDGINMYEITPELIEEFGKMESEQFNTYDEFNRGRVWGLFGEEDTLANFRDVFDAYYSTAIDFKGGHTMTLTDVKRSLVPAIKRMIQEVKPLRERYFRHFKGNEYRLCSVTKDSESQERMVVYQALYGKQDLWVRPETMFFERIIREGQEFPRFTEIDKPDKI